MHSGYFYIIFRLASIGIISCRFSFSRITDKQKPTASVGCADRVLHHYLRPIVVNDAVVVVSWIASEICVVVGNRHQERVALVRFLHVHLVHEHTNSVNSEIRWSYVCACKREAAADCCDDLTGGLRFGCVQVGHVRSRGLAFPSEYEQPSTFR